MNNLCQLISIEELSAVLWVLDPMNTCCGYNYKMFDEYDSEARMIKEHCESGKDFKQAVVDVFDEQFWVGCLDRPECLYTGDKIIQGVGDYLNNFTAEILKSIPDSPWTRRELRIRQEVNSRLPKNRQISSDYFRRHYVLDREIQRIYVD